MSRTVTGFSCEAGWSVLDFFKLFLVRGNVLNLTSPCWPEFSIHSIGKVKLKRTQNLFSLDISLEKRSVHCSYLVRPLVKSARCCHLLMSHRNSLVRTEKSFGSELGELRLRPDGKVMLTTYHQQPGDCGR